MKRVILYTTLERRRHREDGDEDKDEEERLVFWVNYYSIQH